MLLLTRLEFSYFLLSVRHCQWSD